MTFLHFSSFEVKEIKKKLIVLHFYWRTFFDKRNFTRNNFLSHTHFDKGAYIFSYFFYNLFFSEEKNYFDCQQLENNKFKSLICACTKIITKRREKSERKKCECARMKFEIQWSSKKYQKSEWVKRRRKKWILKIARVRNAHAFNGWFHVIAWRGKSVSRFNISAYFMIAILNNAQLLIAMRKMKFNFSFRGF